MNFEGELLVVFIPRSTLIKKNFTGQVRKCFTIIRPNTQLVFRLRIRQFHAIDSIRCCPFVFTLIVVRFFVDL